MSREIADKFIQMSQMFIQPDLLLTVMLSIQ